MSPTPLPARALLLCLALTLAACAEGADDPVDAGPRDGGGACLEGTTMCDGFDELICRDGLYEVTGTANCAPDICEGDNCREACLTAAANNSYLGCEYWAVDLDNAVEVAGPLAGHAIEA